MDMQCDRPELETRIAEGDLSAKQYRIVKDGTGERGMVLCGLGEKPLGVLYDQPQDGEAGGVAEEPFNFVLIEAGAGIAIHTDVACDANGRVITAVAGTHDWIVGETEESCGAPAGSEYEQVVVKWNPRKLATDGNAVIADESTLHLTGGTMSMKSGGTTPTQMSAACTYKDRFLRHAIAGDITSSVTATLAERARAAGTIPAACFSLANTGADAADALSLELDILINGASIFTTKPKLTKDAADGACTDTAGAGVTVGVIDVTKNILVAKDLITYTFTLVRTTPEDEMADALLLADAAYKVGV
jgi:hypothetical protein